MSYPNSNNQQRNNQPRNNSGAMFFNNRKASHKSPDKTGKVIINGVAYYMSVWNKVGKNGTPFESISFTSVAEANARKQGQQGGYNQGNGQGYNQGHNQGYNQSPPQTQPTGGYNQTPPSQPHQKPYQPQAGYNQAPVQPQGQPHAPLSRPPAEPTFEDDFSDVPF